MEFWLPLNRTKIPQILRMLGLLKCIQALTNSKTDTILSNQNMQITLKLQSTRKNFL